MTTYYWALGSSMAGSGDPEQVMVILPAEVAEEIIAYWQASGRTTWGELRQFAPERVVSELENLAEGSEEMAGHLADADRFDMSLIPNWQDGDIPPWALRVMSDSMPKPFLKKFADVGDSVLNGPFATIFCFILITTQFALSFH
jgi:hypothetical protein